MDDKVLYQRIKELSKKIGSDPIDYDKIRDITKKAFEAHIEDLTLEERADEYYDTLANYDDFPPSLHTKD